MLTLIYSQLIICAILHRRYQFLNYQLGMYHHLVYVFSVWSDWLIAHFGSSLYEVFSSSFIQDNSVCFSFCFNGGSSGRSQVHLLDTATLKRLERVTLLRLRGEHSVQGLESLIAEAEQLAAVDTTGVAPLRSLYDFRPVSLIFLFLLSHPDNPQSASSIYRNICENLKCYRLSRSWALRSDEYWLTYREYLARNSDHLEEDYLVTPPGL